jgi:hypothetical protein
VSYYNTEVRETSLSTTSRIVPYAKTPLKRRLNIFHQHSRPDPRCFVTQPPPKRQKHTVTLVSLHFLSLTCNSTPGLQFNRWRIWTRCYQPPSRTNDFSTNALGQLLGVLSPHPLPKRPQVHCGPSFAPSAPHTSTLQYTALRPPSQDWACISS